MIVFGERVIGVITSDCQRANYGLVLVDSAVPAAGVLCRFYGACVIWMQK
jgi:hypothetical protein